VIGWESSFTSTGRSPFDATAQQLGFMHPTPRPAHRGARGAAGSAPSWRAPSPSATRTVPSHHAERASRQPLHPWGSRRPPCPAAAPQRMFSIPAPHRGPRRVRRVDAGRDRVPERSCQQGEPTCPVLHSERRVATRRWGRGCWSPQGSTVTGRARAWNEPQARKRPGPSWEARAHGPEVSTWRSSRDRHAAAHRGKDSGEHRSAVGLPSG
jgi:hypothetical protein